jgi:acetyl-CoA carboxylase carboxyltransferase component
MTVGGLAAFVLYLGMFFGPIQSMGDLYNAVLSAAASAERWRRTRASAKPQAVTCRSAAAAKAVACRSVTASAVARLSGTNRVTRAQDGARACGTKPTCRRRRGCWRTEAIARRRACSGARAKAEAGDVDLHALLPESARRAYDVHPLVEALLDSDEPFEEFQSKWAPSMVVGLGRLSGRTIGVLANNPLRLGGCLNSESAEKAARFVRLCDAFGIPLVVIVDVPGYLPGVDQEWGGVVRRGAKLLHAFGEASVPRVTLVTRKIYGGAYIAMNSRSLGATKVFAWPDAEVAVMGAKAAVGILHKRKLAAAPDHEREALHEELAEEHERIAGGVDAAIEIGVVDEKIDPAHTRSKLTQTLAEAPARRGRHKNIPL